MGGWDGPQSICGYREEEGSGTPAGYVLPWEQNSALSGLQISLSHRGDPTVRHGPLK